MSPLVFAIAGGTGSCYIASVDKNFWGLNNNSHKIDPSISTVNWDPDNTSLIFCQNIGANGVTYDVPITVLSEETSVSNPGCQGYSSKNVQKGDETFSFQTQPPDSCKLLAQWMAGQPMNRAEYKMQYDSLRHYIESCALLDSANSFHAFSKMDADVQEYDLQDTTRYDRYRYWLISIIYLNPNPNYFCACLLSIANAYAEGIYSNIQNTTLAVLKFMIDHKECSGFGIDQQYNQGISSRHATYLSEKEAGDTNAVEDTVLPTLDSIGLGFLLQHSGVNPIVPSSQIYLVSLTSSHNPFMKETTLKFTLKQMAYIQLTIYDELGRLVWGDGRGSSLEAGMHSVQVDGTNLPSGTLYARISTGFGEVKTVKLVHEK